MNTNIFKNKLYRFLLYLIGFTVAASMLFPLIITILSSMKSNTDIMLGMLSLPKTWLLGNYPEAIEIADAVHSIRNSLLIALLTLILSILVAFPASYVLARKTYNFVKPIYYLFMAGVMVPVHCTLTSISEIASKLALKNNYLFLVLVYVAFNLSQAVFLFSGYIKGLSKDFDEAARIDGAGELRIVWRILFPLCKPIIATEAILIFIYGYCELIFSLILITDQQKYPVSRAMLNFTSNHMTSYGPQFAFVIMSIIPMFILYVVLHKQVQAGMLSGAIKG